MRIKTAIKGFYTEYGQLPKSGNNLAAGSSALNEFLMTVLLGKNDTENPRQIMFIDGQPWDRIEADYGCDQEIGAFLDPWGNYYRIALDTDGDGEIENPYDDAGEKMLKADAIVWSLGKDGIQGVKGNPRQFHGSDDVVSWQ